MNFCIDKTIPNGTVLSDKSHEGVDNQASYIVDTDNGSYDKCDSNVVTVKPGEEKPEIEKYINQAVHKDITLDEVFTYDIIAWVTNDADVVTITDELTGKIKFAADPAVKVVDLGADDNHKVTNDISNTKVNDDATVAQAGTAVANADIKTEGKTLTVTIPDATANRGHWIKVTFNATLDVTGETDADKLKDAEAAYTDIAANTPVLSDEAHAGVPNTASYTIGVRKVVKDENGKPVFDENGNVVKEETPTPTYEEKSNTVTVKPEIPEITKYDVQVSKTDINGAEIEGAHIQILKGTEVVEEWNSVAGETKTVKLEPGTYVLKETQVPDANVYVLASDITFTVDEDGKVKVADEDVDKVTMVDDYAPHTIKISKSELGAETVEIPGAEITVTGENGFTETWVSTEEAHELVLKPGRYTMVEVVAPEGFQQVTTEMVFTVDENGKVTLETTAVDGGGRLTAENDHINLEDAPIKPIDIVLEAQKVLEGGNLTAGQFNFAASLTGVTVKDNPVVIPFDAANADRNAANDGTGKVTFDKFEISEEGVYTYTIAEIAGDNADIIYDSALQSVTVTVTKQSVGEGINRGDVLVAEVVYDEGAGATFTNKVRQPGETEVNITGNKTLKVNDSDAPVAAGEFSFQILEKGAVYTDAENSYEYPVDNAPVIRTVTNDGNGVIDFGSFSYSSPGTYSYYLSEVAGNDELGRL